MRVLKVASCKRVAHLSFAPGGGRIAAVTSGAEDHIGSVVWLDTATGEAVRTITLDVERCALSPDHSRLAIAYSPYDRPAGAAPVRWAKVPEAGGQVAWTDLRDVPHPDVFALGFSPDGARLVIGCSGQRSLGDPWVSAVHVAPIGRGKAVTFPVESFAGEAAFSPDGRWLVLAGGPGGDPAVRFHQYPVGEPMAVYAPKATRTRRLVFAPDRSALVALAGKRAVLLWAGRSEPLAVMDGHTARVDDAAFTTDGRRLLTAGQDGAVRVWDAGSGAALGAFAWPVGKLTAVAVAPDGFTAAAAGEKGQVVIWDVDG